MNLVKVSELFDVKYGVSLDLNKLEEVSLNSPGAVPYVGRSEKNNGITAYVKPLPEISPNPPMTISVAGSGSVMSSFLQEISYYSGYHLFYLEPKVPMTKQMLLYYSTALSMNKFKFSYGRQANKTLKHLLIPCTSEIPQEILDYNLENSIEIQEFSALNKKVCRLGEEINFKHEFVLTTLDDIFELHNGIVSTNLAIQPTKADENLIPYVRPSKWQSTSYAGYVDKETIPENKIFPEGTLYVSTNGAGSHTYAYVSIETFAPNSDVTVLIPKQELTLEQKLIYATYITANRFKFSYGRKPKGNKLKKILLPKL